MPQDHSAFIQSVTERVRKQKGETTATMFERCFADTLETTLTKMTDGTLFTLTGDIPAMWLRDSTTQLTPYLHFADVEPAIADMIAAVSRRQLDYVLVDPYANAFNPTPNGDGHRSDRTEQSPWVWERKYEVDSLCYPLQLAYDLWQMTGRTDHLGEVYVAAVRKIIELWRVEQDHDAKSPYRFQRFDGPPSDTLVREGLGGETVRTGLTWSGFRPSDDACVFGYNVPGNMFAVIELTRVEELALTVLHDQELADQASALRTEIAAGLAGHAIVEAERFGSVYAYEVDGNGGVLLTDDANVPSLLSLPLLGWCNPDDPLYLATRALALSDANPTFVSYTPPSGRSVQGIGSSHTPDGHIWPIALCVEALTTNDFTEKERILSLLLESDAGTGLMHESFLATDPTVFTRSWFSWANAMFCELVLDIIGERRLIRTPLVNVMPV